MSLLTAYKYPLSGIGAEGHREKHRDLFYIAGFVI
jgi:hypothetical protein